MTAAKTRLAHVDIGESGTPGTGASQILASVYRLPNGRYEITGSVSIGCNQGYYQENFAHGPWRGRGATIKEARDTMLGIVPDEHQADMRRATLEAIYDAEDAEIETSRRIEDGTL